MRAAPVSEEPEVTLVHWGILMLPGGDMYLTGLRADREAKARTTSPLVQFDAAKMEAETQSGRHYNLKGPPDDNTAFEIACVSWGYVTAACSYPVSAEEAQLRLEEPPTHFVQ